MAESAPYATSTRMTSCSCSRVAPPIFLHRRSYFCRLLQLSIAKKLKLVAANKFHYLAWLWPILNTLMMRGDAEHRIVLNDLMSALEHEFHTAEISKCSP